MSKRNLMFGGSGLGVLMSVFYALHVDMQNSVDKIGNEIVELRLVTARNAALEDDLNSMQYELRAHGDAAGHALMLRNEGQIRQSLTDMERRITALEGRE